MMRENNYEIDLAIQRARSFADRFGDIEIDSYQGIPIFAAPGVHAMTLDRLQSQLPAGAPVLDLGAGAGAFSKRISDAGYEVTACDLFDGNFAPQAALRFVTADLNGNFSTVAKGSWDAVGCSLHKFSSAARHVGTGIFGPRPEAVISQRAW